MCSYSCSQCGVGGLWDELLSLTLSEFPWAGCSCKEVGVPAGTEVCGGSFGEVLR